MNYEPLPREEVIKAVERRSPSRIPIIRGQWWGEGFEDLHGKALKAFARYPEDAVQVFFDTTPYERMGLSWKIRAGVAIDSQPILPDWDALDELIGKLPSPESDPEIQEKALAAEKAHRDGRYLLFSFWRLFFEKPWEIRGMENLLTDYYMHPQNVLRLNRALCDQYLRYIRWAATTLKPDGFFTSDDLGHQTGPMMSPATFHEFLYPFYCEIGAECGRHGLHFWLHSCGDNTLLLPDLVSSGLDVFHPVQKGTMDEKRTALEFGDRLSFLIGFDVQHVLREGSPGDVRAEVRFLIDTFDGPGGGLCLGAGNGILPGTPLANVDAFLDETLRYGAEHRERFG